MPLAVLSTVRTDTGTDINRKYFYWLHVIFFEAFGIGKIVADGFRGQNGDKTRP